MQAKKRWTEAEENLLREKWGKVTVAELCVELSRAKPTIYAKAKDMGLGKPLRPPSHWRGKLRNGPKGEPDDDEAELQELPEEKTPEPKMAPPAKRRLIDPTTCERDYSDDETQFMKAMDQYKRENRRPFPTWSEVLEVLRAVGYRKVAEPSQMPGLSTKMPPTIRTIRNTSAELTIGFSDGEHAKVAFPVCLAFSWFNAAPIRDAS